MASDFETALEAILSRELKGFASLESCDQLSAGASLETYRITVNTNAGTQRLALRRMQPTMAEDSRFGSISLETEAKLFQLAAENDIPAPRVVYVLDVQDGMGSGFLMEWLEGETLGQRIVRSEALADIRPQLAYECGEILGRIHALDWQSAKLSGELPVVEPETLVDETWESYRELGVPVPMIDYAWRWLKDHLPENPRSVLVHSDFRNGNLMIDQNGIKAVLDWELAHVGDPVRDLGWLCVNSWRFGIAELPVGGFGHIDDLLAGYQQSSGITVSREHLEFWQVFGSFWWAGGTLQMVNAWRTGDVPSLERPVIGRRSSEAQMDCVNLLLPGDYALPDNELSISEGTQLPMPAELLESVAIFLKDEVAKQLDTHTGFMARVAANSLNIAQRELLHGAGLAAAERDRLATLLGQDGELDTLRWELVKRLRSDLPLDTPGLGSHLRQTVAGQLAIDQPKYTALSSN